MKAEKWRARSDGKLLETSSRERRTDSGDGLFVAVGILWCFLILLVSARPLLRDSIRRGFSELQAIHHINPRSIADA